MLEELVISQVRVDILKFMLPKPEESYHIRALVRAVDTEINAVRRELKRLHKIGLLRKRPSGNRIYYSVDTASPYYPELLSLIAKEDGIGKDIIDSAKRLGNIKYAILSRAFSRGLKRSVLDVDLFIVGEVNLDQLGQLVQKYERKLNREINYSVMPEEDFEFRKRKNDQFVMKVLGQSRTMLIGDEEKFSLITS